MVIARKTSFGTGSERGDRFIERISPGRWISDIHCLIHPPEWEKAANTKSSLCWLPFLTAKGSPGQRAQQRIKSAYAQRVESMIRQVINLRLKGCGKFWKRENAERMLLLRSFFVTGRLDALFDFALEHRVAWWKAAITEDSCASQEAVM